MRQETEQWKTECAYWQEQAEANQKHIQSLEATLKVFQQKEMEWNEERRKTKEKNRLRKDGTLSFMNESIDSWTSWAERMENDYKVMKEQIEKIAKEFSKLQNALRNSTKAHEPEKDVDVLTKKIQPEFDSFEAILGK
ncbi:hypothetical protein [Geobacillus sp. WSUCF-018B]|uniref:hypothetical protein n=1 Tax=Geobacillus sp. WSUCF-018B TaxID=2055939 RepID=UPI001E2FEAF5|nr:hypothetical protein [Geobacillus sp. WSUCF-018B]WJQ01794.1 hypothetical protein QT234_08460 [Geobacillus stearothermophilus]WJQ05208.1 hypothetical protein QT236_08295 [Geobacillus stearothermophilus]